MPKKTREKEYLIVYLSGPDGEIIVEPKTGSQIREIIRSGQMHMMDLTIIDGHVVKGDMNTSFDLTKL